MVAPGYIAARFGARFDGRIERAFDRLCWIAKTRSMWLVSVMDFLEKLAKEAAL